MNKHLLFLIIAFSMIISAIILTVLLSITFKKSPSINLIQGRLKDEGDDLEKAMKYLKITNME